MVPYYSSLSQLIQPPRHFSKCTSNHINLCLKSFNNKKSDRFYLLSTCWGQGGSSLLYLILTTSLERGITIPDFAVEVKWYFKKRSLCQFPKSGEQKGWILTLDLFECRSKASIACFTITHGSANFFCKGPDCYDMTGFAGHIVSVLQLNTAIHSVKSVLVYI